MSSMKASLILCFLFFLLLQHNFFTTRLATADLSHDNLPVQSDESKHDGDAYADKTAELAVVVKRGGGGGHGGGGHGGGGHGGGGGGRSFGGGGRGFPYIGGGGGSHQGGKSSSSERKSARVWLGLSTLLGLVLGV